MNFNQHNVRTVRCRDGSDTLFSEQFGQHYHNPNGAIEESRYVFFEQSGLVEAFKQNIPIRIFEMGFGTGLNLLLLADYVERYPNYSHPILFQSVEAFPISVDHFMSMNYAERLGKSEAWKQVANFFGNVQEGTNAFEIALSGGHTSLIKAQIFSGLYAEMNLQSLQQEYDFIFFDAFSPEANPELWLPDVFKTLLQSTTENGILATYGAASAARAAMAYAGWKLAKCRGALGKREMTLASPSISALDREGLKPVNAQRLARRWAAGEFDS